MTLARSAIKGTLLACLLSTPSLADSQFSDPGKLEPNSGQGFTDTRIFLPNMRFPIERAPAFVNSQVYRPGGSAVDGSQCDSRNYSYPWRDNYCESRSWSMPLCAAGKGHQGNDIRPSTCQRNTHWAVAADNGVITSIGTYSVTLQTAQGTIYRYLHLQMDDLAIRLNQRVHRGDRVGKVSNYFGTTSTTTHLHFDVKDSVRVGNSVRVVYVPPYSSLVNSYKKLLAGNP